MNIYRHRFVSKCPANGDLIVYDLVIETASMVLVEDILLACAANENVWHEHLADDFYHRLGGKQTIIAVHHGVTIETRRG